MNIFHHIAMHWWGEHNHILDFSIQILLNSTENWYALNSFKTRNLNFRYWFSVYVIMIFVVLMQKVSENLAILFLSTVLSNTKAKLINVLQ